MIKMSKSGEGFFWIGGPGEEAFNVCLGLQVLKGRGPAFDYVHPDDAPRGVEILRRGLETSGPDEVEAMDAIVVDGLEKTYGAGDGGGA